MRRNTTPAQVKFQQLRRILEQPKSLVSKSRVHPLSFIVEPRSVLLPRYIIIIYIEKKKENRGFFSFFLCFGFCPLLISLYLLFFFPSYEFSFSNLPFSSQLNQKGSEKKHLQVSTRAKKSLLFLFVAPLTLLLFVFFFFFVCRPQSFVCVKTLYSRSNSYWKRPILVKSDGTPKQQLYTHTHTRNFG